MLEAGQRIVEREGFDRLSFARIAEESGVYQSAIRYYFGSKRGLVEALLDSTTHDLSAQIDSQEVASDGPLPPRLKRYVRASSTLPGSREYRFMWELLPHVLRRKDFCEGVAQLYDMYRGHSENVFGTSLDPRYSELARSYACLMIAVLDGMAIQKALDPANVDVEKVFELWADVLSRSVEDVIYEELS